MLFAARGLILYLCALLPFALAARRAIPGGHTTHFITASPSVFLSAHNAIRFAHGAKALTWSDSLAAKAQSWASACKFEPTGGSLSDQPYGENIAAGTGVFGVQTFVNHLVEDIGAYNPSNPTYNHFTQVVWKSTTELGCATARCDGIMGGNKATLYVCLYNPPGNIVGEASANVQV